MAYARHEMDEKEAAKPPVFHCAFSSFPCLSQATFLVPSAIRFIRFIRRQNLLCLCRVKILRGKTRNRKDAAQNAFTLVEVLVTVTLIAILSGLLLAAVDSVRGESESAQCTANLRQLLAANFSYASDHDGQFVFAQEPSNTIRWHGVRGSVDGKFDPTKGPLAPYLGHEGRIKLCPALQRVLTGSESFENGTGGYGYNAAYIGGTPMDIWTAEHLARLERAARTVMFADTAFPREDGLQEYAYCEPWTTEYPLLRFRGQLSASVHFRHFGKANVAWCDGHVTAEPPSRIDGTNGYGGDARKWKIGWFGPREMNGYWRPY